MLEGLRSGKRSILRHVADEDDRDAVALGQFHQALGALSHLADTTGGSLELVRGYRLDRIHHQHGRPPGESCIRDAPDLVFGDDVDSVADSSG